MKKLVLAVTLFASSVSFGGIITKGEGWERIETFDAGEYYIDEYTGRTFHGHNAGLVTYEVQTEYRDSLSLFAYDKYTDSFLDMIASGTEELKDGFWNYKIQGYLNYDPSANAYAVKLASNRAFTMTYENPNIDFTQLNATRSDEYATLNPVTESANVSEPGALALLVMGLGGLLARRKKVVL